MCTRSAWCKVLVNLIATTWTVVYLNGLTLDLHKTTKNVICELACGKDPNSWNCSCDTLLDKASTNIRNFDQTLFCKSDDIIAFKLNGIFNSTAYYVLEKTEKDSQWQYVAYGKIPKSKILSASKLKGNTEYKVKTWIVESDGQIIYQPIETEWLRTPPHELIPLPVPHMTSNYSLTQTGLVAIVEWIPAEDLSCYYMYSYHSTTPDNHGYDNIRVTETLFKVSIPVTYNLNYSISIRAQNSDFTMESPPTTLAIETPSCLSVHKNLSICVPAKPQDLEVEELLNKTDHSRYNIKISWSVPQYVPDYYEILFSSFEENNTIKFNVSGIESSAIIKDVRIQGLYYVAITARSTAGESETNTYRGHIKHDHQNYSSYNVSVVWISIALFLIICCCICLSIIINRQLENRRRTRKRNLYFKDLAKKCQTVGNMKNSQYEMHAQSPDERVINPENLTLQRTLGEGAFGVVKYGILSTGKTTMEIAAKTLRSSPSREELEHFQHELETLKVVGSHPHLVSLMGVCLDSSFGPLLVVEYCAKGDLQNYLKNIWEKITHASATYLSDKDASAFANKLYDTEPINLYNNELINSRELLSFAIQIAKGMEYLSTLKILHRDLAARNILICEDLTVKVSDFGLSRDVYRDNVYRKKAGGRLPIRWMAIECLTHQQYTTQSDVWSFGILLWEIVTLGGNPYPGIPMENLLKLLKAGYRMECPINCRLEVYDIMVKCWKANPIDRMTFKDIRIAIENLLESQTEYLQVDLNTCVQMNVLKINSYKNVENTKSIFERYVKPIWH